MLIEISSNRSYNDMGKKYTRKILKNIYSSNYLTRKFLMWKIGYLEIYPIFNVISNTKFKKNQSPQFHVEQFVYKKNTILRLIHMKK